MKLPAVFVPIVVVILLGDYHPAETPAVQEPVFTVVRRSGMVGVGRVALAGGIVDTIYRSNAVSVSNLDVAPSGRFLAILEMQDLTTRSQRLIVMSPAGDVITRIERDVRAYAWCCGTQTLALITGSWSEDGHIGFRPSGARIVDIESGSDRSLDVPSDVYGVAWAAFDGALYFKRIRGYPRSNIIRYDPTTGQSRVTNYWDLRFSPSGAHYLHHFRDIEFGPPGVHIFQRETGRQVPDPDSSLGSIQGWVFGQGDYLQLKRSSYPEKRGMFAGPERIEGYTIYEVVAGAAVAEITGPVRTDLVATHGALVLAGGDGTLRLVRSISEVRR